MAARPLHPSAMQRCPPSQLQPIAAHKKKGVGVPDPILSSGLGERQLDTRSLPPLHTTARPKQKSSAYPTYLEVR